MLRVSRQRLASSHARLRLGGRASDAEPYLVGSPGHAAGFINEGEHCQVGVDRGPLQQVQTILVVNELHIAPVNALSSIFLLWHKGSSQISSSQTGSSQTSSSQTSSIMSKMNP